MEKLYLKMHPKLKKSVDKISTTQATVRDCCDCGEGLCCSSKTSNVISPEALLERLEENPCDGSSCEACGEECGGHNVFIFA